MQNEEPQEVDLNSPEWKELYEYERDREILPHSPNNPPWNGWMSVGVWVFSVLIIAFLPVVFLIPYLITQNISLTDAEGLANFLKENKTAILINLVAVFPAHLFTLAVAWFVVTKNRKYSFREMLGWSQGGFRWYFYILIVIGFFAVAAIVSQFLPEQENELTRILQSSYTATLIVAFLATFTAPLVEEVVYRGLIYSAFQRKIGIPGAVAVVTMIFAGVHFLQYWGSPGTILLICLLSLILTLVRVKTDNLLPCIILHTIFNGVQSLLLVLQPYLPQNVTETKEAVSSIIHLLPFN